ncbi:MAG: M20/M25/M40 family metallo-hydrolase [Gammaproteobacteria bacterium]|nr:M20/M25/M40 family metallo-hydrolase [Gammaproteobacteria bacterium]
MRRLLLWTASAGLALSGTIVTVLLVRAAMLTPVPRPEGEPLPFAFDELGAPVRLAAALGVLGEGEEGPGLAAVLEAGFPLLHAALRRETGAAGTLLYEWPGSDAALPPVVLSARLDGGPVRTVSSPVAPAGTIDGGFIHGRGARGGTGSALALLESVEGLLSAGFAPRRTVIIVLGRVRPEGTGAPERTAAGILGERGIRPAWVLTDGLFLISGFFPGIRDPVGAVAVAGKREMDLRLTARSEPGSASLPPRRSAAGILGEAVGRLDGVFAPALVEPNLELVRTLGARADPGTRLLAANLWLFARPFARALTERPLLNASLRTTVVVDSIGPSAPDGALSRELSARVRLALAPWNEPAAAVEELRERLVDLPLTVEPAGGPLPATAGSTSSSGSMSAANAAGGFRAIRAAIHLVFPDVAAVVPAVTPLPGQIADFRALAGEVYGFAPFRMDEEALLALPGSLDRVRTGVYTAAVRFYAELIARSAG